jgi:hypothetical protein
MAHAEHFLTRLDRLAGPDVELALGLYRDPELLRSIVAAATLPEAAARLAISLDDPDAGPFLVVTRTGDFVTCLGRGMRPGGLPVVTRGELDTCARQIDRLRDVMALAQRARNEARQTRQMLRRLFEVPDALSREDFREIATWEPLLGASFLTTYVAMGAELSEMGPIVRNARPRGSRGDDMLRDYWNLLHGAGHLALLGSMARDQEVYGELTRDLEGAQAAFSYPLVGTGIVTFMLKGAWAAARMGKRLLPAYKRALAADVALYELVDTLLALLALGTRTSGLRAEIQKALRAAPGRATTPEAERLRATMGPEIDALCEAAASLLDGDPDDPGFERSLQHMGRSFFTENADTIPDDAETRDVLRTLPLLLRVDGISRGTKLLTTMQLVAASASGPPEQFYLPRAALKAMRTPWRPADTLAILEPLMAVDRARRKPVVRGVDIGRNDPCFCNSGRKWKKCCAPALPPT